MKTLEFTNQVAYHLDSYGVGLAISDDGSFTMHYTKEWESATPEHPDGRQVQITSPGVRLKIEPMPHYYTPVDHARIEMCCVVQFTGHPQEAHRVYMEALPELVAAFLYAARGEKMSHRILIGIVYAVICFILLAFFNHMMSGPVWNYLVAAFGSAVAGAVIGRLA